MLKKEIILSKLTSVIEHIEKINEYFSSIKNSDDYVLKKDGELIFDATLMRLQALGETLKQIENKAPEIFAKHNAIEWVKIIRLRDIISHHYEKLQSEIVFEICHDFIPKLEKEIRKIIKELE